MDRTASPLVTVATTQPVAAQLEETMLRPPRRRKQKQQQQQTGTKSQLLDSSLHDDEEYSFASLASTTATVTSKMPSSTIAAVQKYTQKSVSSGRSAIEKENSVNDDDRCDRKASKVGNAVDRAPLHHTATRTYADVDSRSSMLDSMEELSGSLNDLTLDRNSPDISAIDHTMSTATFPPIGFGATNITISVNDDGKPRRIILNALQLIEKSGEKDLVHSLFQIPAMVNAVASASWSLGPSEYMLILEENTTKLINIAKQCLKVLSSFTSSNATKKSSSNTSSDGGAKDDLEMALLRVALHSLRSILPILLESESDPSKLQVVLKLFYHCVVISGDACQRSFQSFASSSSRKKNVLKVMAYAIICLGAYEGLGACIMPRNENSAPNKRGTVAWDELLPAIGKDDKATTKILPHIQLVRIAMESALCASSSLLNMSLVSLRVGLLGINELWAIPDEFHFVASVLVETCSDEEQKNPMFLKLLLHVAYPYVMQSLYISAEDGDSPNFNAGALRHVTKVFRILWDGASSVEEVCSLKNSIALRTSCFQLRKDGILFILRALKSVFAHRQELPRENSMSIYEEEVYSLFDRASLSAMKSVGIFDKAPGITQEIQDKKSALLHFHDVVGNALDCIATYLCSGRSLREEIPLPSSYYEYCVYRSIHRWRLQGLVQSDDKPPHLYHGRSATRAINKNAESLVSICTFTIIHIVLRALHRLKIDTETMEISDSDYQQAIANFDAVVLDSVSPSNHSRCRSLLLMIDLQREATNIISTDQTDNSHCGKEQCIALLASVIGNCFAPLDAKLSLSTNDQTKCLNFRLSCADSCVKSASLLGIASDVSASKSDEYSIQANTQLRKSFDILMIEIGRMEGKNIDRRAPPILAIEMFAKVRFYSFSKRKRRIFI
jgi:hypothetical protein